VQLEEEALARIQAAVAERYAAAIAGPEVGLLSRGLGVCVEVLGHFAGLRRKP
jgi:hypothetical protein